MSEGGAAPGPGQLPAGHLVASRYRIEAVIGEGAQSVVYLARRVREGDLVALKVIHRHLSGNAQLAKRFHREASILRQLAGEHIVELLDFFEEDGLLVLAIEHVTGTSLEAMLAERAPLDLDVALEIALQVCAALGVAHANDVVHRDLKPANVLIERPRGEPASNGSISARGLKVKVVDFGLGKVLHGAQMTTGLTEQGMIFGTPEYMAPEMASGDEVDARADLYAAGVMLYEMAVGEVPFKAKSAVGTMSAHLHDPLPSPRQVRPDVHVPPALEAVIRRALAKSPGDRYASARELAEAIAAARDEPRVIRPSGVTHAEGIAESDTDLHLERQSFGQARTLRAEEVAAIAAAEQERRSAAPAASQTGRPQEIEVTPPRPAKAVRLAIDEAPPTQGGVATRSSGYVWAVVAVVAALVGVAIGVFVGMR